MLTDISHTRLISLPENLSGAVFCWKCSGWHLFVAADRVYHSATHHSPTFRQKCLEWYVARDHNSVAIRPKVGPFSTWLFEVQNPAQTLDRRENEWNQSNYSVYPVAAMAFQQNVYEKRYFPHAQSENIPLQGQMRWGDRIVKWWFRTEIKCVSLLHKDKRIERLQRKLKPQTASTASTAWAGLPIDFSLIMVLLYSRLLVPL